MDIRPVRYKKTNDQTNSKLRVVKIESLYEPRANTIMFPFGVTWPRHRPCNLRPDQ